MLRSRSLIILLPIVICAATAQAADRISGYIWKNGKPIELFSPQSPIAKLSLFFTALLISEISAQASPWRGQVAFDAAADNLPIFKPAAYRKSKIQMRSGEHVIHEYKFDPRYQAVKIAYASLGDLVSNFVLDTGAEAGVNGGFWNDIYSQNTFSRYTRKLASRWGISDYIPAPAAILEIDNKIIADSGSQTPALGWTKDGRYAYIGEVSSQWVAKISDMV